MKTSHTTPYHFLNANSSLIEKHRFSIEAAVNANPQKLALSISPALVEMRIVNGPQEIVLALQHHPQHIKKMLGTLHFDFQLQEDMEVYLPEEEWKMKPAYLQWFQAMAGLEVMPFFVSDKDVRLYMLAGDYLAGKQPGIAKKAVDGGRFKYEVRGLARNAVGKRLLACCSQFMLYCHNTGFDPKEAIHEMLADYTLPVQYADIYKQYQKDIKNYHHVWSLQGPAYRFRAA